MTHSEQIPPRKGSWPRHEVSPHSEWITRLGPGHLQRYAAGATIFVPGAARDVLMLVETGAVRVYLNGGGRELTLCHLRAGGVFSTHTRAWMSALEHSEIRSWPLSRMMGLIAQEPTLGAAAFRDVGQILSGALTLLEDLAFRPVGSRLAGHLLRQRKALGTDTIPIGHTGALAETLGTSRQTLSSQINRLIREGLLARPDRLTLVVLNPERLRALAEVSAG